MMNFTIYPTWLEARNNFTDFGSIGRVMVKNRPCVYAIELDGGKEVKIGYSSNIYGRLPKLDTDYRYNSRMGRAAIAFFDEAKDWEYQFHRFMHESVLLLSAVEWEVYNFTDFFKPIKINSFDCVVNYIAPLFDGLTYPKYRGMKSKDWRKIRERMKNADMVALEFDGHNPISTTLQNHTADRENTTQDKVGEQLSILFS